MSRKHPYLLPCVLAAVAAVLLASGALSGGPAVIFSKAARVCLECIGVG